MAKKPQLIVALVALVAIMCMWGAWRLAVISTSQTMAMIEAVAAAAAKFAPKNDATAAAFLAEFSWRTLSCGRPVAEQKRNSTAAVSASA